MSDNLVAALVWALRPYDRAWEWHVRRQYRKGKFKRPYGDPRELNAGAVTTRSRECSDTCAPHLYLFCSPECEREAS